MESLNGRRVLVTGGTKGIGRALCRKLVDAGARVFATGTTPAHLEDTARELGIPVFEADVADEGACRRAVETAARTLEGLDALVNNAGIGTRGKLEELSLEEFQRVFTVNVFGAALMAREALPHLEAAGGGDIVNVASTAGKKGYPGGSVYAASKFALHGMGECWQAELRPRNVRVTNLHPSYVHTGFSTGSDAEGERPHHLQAEDIADTILLSLALPRRAFLPDVSVFATNPWAGEEKRPGS